MASKATIVVPAGDEEKFTIDLVARLARVDEAPVDEPAKRHRSSAAAAAPDLSRTVEIVMRPSDSPHLHRNAAADVTAANKIMTQVPDEAIYASQGSTPPPGSPLRRDFIRYVLVKFNCGTNFNYHVFMDSRYVWSFTCPVCLGTHACRVQFS
jgi:hypothetical protein